MSTRRFIYAEMPDGSKISMWHFYKKPAKYTTPLITTVPGNHSIEEDGPHAETLRAFASQVGATIKVEECEVIGVIYA